MVKFQLSIPRFCDLFSWEEAMHDSEINPNVWVMKLFPIWEYIYTGNEKLSKHGVNLETCCTKILKTVCAFICAVCLHPSWRRGQHMLLNRVCSSSHQNTRSIPGGAIKLTFQKPTLAPCDTSTNQEVFNGSEWRIPCSPNIQNQVLLQNYESFQPIHFLQLDIFPITMPWCKLC